MIDSFAEVVGAPGMALAGKDAAWKGRVEQIEELAQTDPVLGQRLRAARSLELLKAHDSRKRDSESDFAAAMMRREKEDLLRINARVRQVNQWCKQLGEDRRYTLVKYPSDLTTPYGRFMAKHDASVAQKAALLKSHLALPAAPSAPRQRPTREDVYTTATAAMRSPERQVAGSSAAGPRPGRPSTAKSASHTTATPSRTLAMGEAARPASAALARATVPPVTTSRVVIRLAQASGEPRQLSVALFEREVAKLSRRVAEARAAGTLGQSAGGADPVAKGSGPARGKRGADSLLISEASALVDARASPMAATAAAAARARQSKAQVQAELRRALRETAFLTQALRTQAKVLRDKGWNAGGRSGAVPRAPEGAAELARTIARSGTAPWED